MPAKDHFNTIVVTKEQIEEALEEMLVELNYRVNAEDMHDTLDALTKFADYCVPENIIAKNKENNIISIIKGDIENIDTIYSSIRLMSQEGYVLLQYSTLNDNDQEEWHDSGDRIDIVKDTHIAIVDIVNTLPSVANDGDRYIQSTETEDIIYKYNASDGIWENEHTVDGEMVSILSLNYAVYVKEGARFRLADGNVITCSSINNQAHLLDYISIGYDEIVGDNIVRIDAITSKEEHPINIKDGMVVRFYIHSFNTNNAEGDYNDYPVYIADGNKRIPLFSMSTSDSMVQAKAYSIIGVEFDSAFGSIHGYGQYALTLNNYTDTLLQKSFVSDYSIILDDNQQTKRITIDDNNKSFVVGNNTTTPIDWDNNIEDEGAGVIVLPSNIDDDMEITLISGYNKGIEVRNTPNQAVYKIKPSHGARFLYDTLGNTWRKEDLVQEELSIFNQPQNKYVKSTLKDVTEWSEPKTETLNDFSIQESYVDGVHCFIVDARSTLLKMYRQDYENDNPKQFKISVSKIDLEDYDSEMFKSMPFYIMTSLRIFDTDGSHEDVEISSFGFIDGTSTKLSFSRLYNKTNVISLVNPSSTPHYNIVGYMDNAYSSSDISQSVEYTTIDLTNIANTYTFENVSYGEYFINNKTTADIDLSGEYDPNSGTIILPTNTDNVISGSLFLKIGEKGVWIKNGELYYAGYPHSNIYASYDESMEVWNIATDNQIEEDYHNYSVNEVFDSLSTKQVTPVVWGTVYDSIAIEPYSTDSLHLLDRILVSEYMQNQDEDVEIYPGIYVVTRINSGIVYLNKVANVVDTDVVRISNNNVDSVYVQVNNETYIKIDAQKPINISGKIGYLTQSEHTLVPRGTKCFIDVQSNKDKDIINKLATIKDIPIVINGSGIRAYYKGNNGEIVPIRDLDKIEINADTLGIKKLALTGVTLTSEENNILTFNSKLSMTSLLDVNGVFSVSFISTGEGNVNVTGMTVGYTSDVIELNVPDYDTSITLDDENNEYTINVNTDNIIGVNVETEIVDPYVIAVDLLEDKSIILINTSSEKNFYINVEDDRTFVVPPTNVAYGNYHSGNSGEYWTFDVVNPKEFHVTTNKNSFACPFVVSQRGNGPSTPYQDDVSNGNGFVTYLNPNNMGVGALVNIAFQWQAIDMNGDYANLFDGISQDSMRMYTMTKDMKNNILEWGRLCTAALDEVNVFVRKKCNSDGGNIGADAGILKLLKNIKPRFITHPYWNSSQQNCFAIPILTAVMTNVASDIEFADACVYAASEHYSTASSYFYLYKIVNGAIIEYQTNGDNLQEASIDFINQLFND